MGRKKADIDPAMVERLARLGCEVSEIAECCHACRQTIHRRFQAELDRGRANMKISIRRAQYRRAVKDNSDRMLIHLGRIYLDQRPGGGSGADVLDAILTDLLEKNGDVDGDGDGD